MTVDTPMWAGAKPVIMEVWTRADSPFLDVTEATLDQLATSTEYPQVELVRRDLDGDAVVADQRGARSVPTYFVNGHRLRGAQSASAILRLVRMELADLEVTP